MRRLLFIGIACASAFSAGVQANEPTNITPGQSHTFEFAGDEPIELLLDANGTALIRVSNIRRDSILTVTMPGGERLLRSAGWRGPEHHYFAVLDVESTVRLSIEPDDPVSPPGQVEILVELAEPDSNRVVAEREMTAATDLNLSYHFGEPSDRETALAGFQEAARLFDAAGNSARRADALFEAANVSDMLCKRSLAHQLLEQASLIWSDLEDDRGLAAAENMRGLIYWGAGDGDTSKALFDAAASKRARLDDDYFYAEAINNLGLVHRERGDAQLAAEYFLDAIRIWQGDVDILRDDIDIDRWLKLDNPPSLRHSLTGLNNLGWASEVFGDVEDTQRIWLRALELTDNLSNNFTASTLKNNLGNMKRRSGEMDEALRLLGAALEYFTETSPDEYWAGRVHFNLGQLHRDLGDTSRALQSFGQSLTFRTPECDPVGRAETLKEIAELEVNAGRVDPALDLINQGYDLLRPYPGNTIAEARLRELQGRALMTTGRIDEAITQYDDAVSLYRSIGDRYGELVARTHRARANNAMGRHFAAIPELRTALELAQQVDSRLEEFRVHTAMGEVHLAANDPESAVASAERAISLSEAVRQQLVLPVLLRDFASVQRSAYDVLVRALLSLDQVGEAWIASDSGRARRFSDVIRQSDVDLSLLDQDQRRRYAFLVGAIAQRAEARTHLLARNDADSAEVVLRELLPLIDELDQLQQRARRPDVDHDAPVELAALQQVLAAGDIVLEYHVGASVAGVWTITRNSISFSEIPLLPQLVDRVEGVKNAIRQRRQDLAGMLEQIAKDVLKRGPLDSQDHDNLIIVPDGPLHYLPFSALPDPSTGWRDPLVANRTVSYLPSLGVLIQLRRRQSTGAEGIAILADPIFQPEDPRVQQRENETPSGLAAIRFGNELLRSMEERTGVAGFPRLPGTLDEARAIEDAAGDTDVLPLYGADANRETVLSGRLKPYGILHFATHGILDDVEPALSGIVLSGVTLDGRRRNSLLRSQDIVGLDLDARLVVLSGCETGLGRPVHGEGLVGLSRAFFYAGARQVISTLWQVPDQATAELMGHFYRAMLEDGVSVPEALRYAQLEIFRDPRWSNPYYWAPFVLQGDWSEATGRRPSGD